MSKEIIVKFVLLMERERFDKTEMLAKGKFDEENS